MNLRQEDVFPLSLVPFPYQAECVTLSLLSNLGTYNNQYMVLDLKKVRLKKSLDDGALYIVEQIPTLVQYSDQTNILRKGNSFYSSYWLQKAISVPADGGSCFILGRGLLNTGAEFQVGKLCVSNPLLPGL